MNRLSSVHFQNPAPMMKPYRKYSAGDRVYVLPQSYVSGLFSHFPRSKGHAVIESVNDDSYIIIPEGYNDRIEASHWCLRLVTDLHESKMFAPVNSLRSGVYVMLRNGDIKMIKESGSRSTIMDDDTRIDNNTPAQIIRRSDDSKQISAFIRE